MARDLDRAALPCSQHRGTLTFGTTEAECHVLDDERHLLTSAAMMRLFGSGQDANIKRLLARIPQGTRDFSSGPEIRFRLPGNNAIASGYDSDFVVDVCRAYVEALAAGTLHAKQVPIAARASVLLAACAKVGLAGLIAEATGYDKVRGARGLQDKLAAALMQEAGRWRPLFTREFFFEMAKLYRLQLTTPGRRPLCFASFIREFFYEWFDDDVYAELKRRNPRPSEGTKHHQFLAPFARERFVQHQRDVLLLMRTSADLPDFRMRFNSAFRGAGLQLAFGGRS